MKEEKKKARRIAFFVTFILLILVVVGTLVFDHYMTSIQFDLLGMIIGHALGFVLMYLVIYHFLKPEEPTQPMDHNIY